MVKATHSAAAQVAVAALIVSAVVLGLPAFAEDTTTTVVPVDTYFAGKIVNQFQRSGLVSSYDNTSLTTSVFDFTAYMRNVCFNPTAYDLPDCQAKFGPYANLQDTLMNGQLLSILKLFGLIDDAHSDLVRIVQNQVKAGSIPAQDISPVGDITRSVAERSADVWRVCKAHYTEKQELWGCFQRNQRLVTRYDVPVLGNVH